MARQELGEAKTDSSETTNRMRKLSSYFENKKKKEPETTRELRSIASGNERPDLLKNVESVETRFGSV